MSKRLYVFNMYIEDQDNAIDLYCEGLPAKNQV